jgi:hypothetical protein
VHVDVKVGGHMAAHVAAKQKFELVAVTILE